MIGLSIVERVFLILDPATVSGSSIVEGFFAGKTMPEQTSGHKTTGQKVGQKNGFLNLGKHQEFLFYLVAKPSNSR